MAAPQRVPIEDGFFTIPDGADDAPRLLGTRCRNCNERFFPKRVVCAKCLSQDVEDVHLGPHGILFTWTFVHFPLFGSTQRESKGYGVGQIDLPEGPRVQSVLSGGPDDFRVGMPMRLELETLHEDSEGREVVIFRFRPDEDGS